MYSSAKGLSVQETLLNHDSDIIVWDFQCEQSVMGLSELVSSLLSPLLVWPCSHILASKAAPSNAFANMMPRAQLLPTGRRERFLKAPVQTFRPD